MTDKEAYTLIGERVAQLAKDPKVRKIITQEYDLKQEHDREAAIKKMYMLAIATLCGRETK